MLNSTLKSFVISSFILLIPLVPIQNRGIHDEWQRNTNPLTYLDGLHP